MTASAPGPELDRSVRATAENLTGAAVAVLTPVVCVLPLEALTPVKQLLKRFFSDEPWGMADDDELARVVGPGHGSGRHEPPGPPPGLELGRRPVHRASSMPRRTARVPDGPDPRSPSMAWLFPKPRPAPAPSGSRRGPSAKDRAERSTRTTSADDPRVAGLFAAFDEVTNVLVGPNFVAVTILHANGWQPFSRRCSARSPRPSSSPSRLRDTGADAPTVPRSGSVAGVWERRRRARSTGRGSS